MSRCQAPARVLAVDRSATMVRHAREADPELDVPEADAASLPLEDGAIERLREIPDTSEDPHEGALRWRRISLFLHIRAITRGVSSDG
jgi:hypothetical protein